MKFSKVASWFTRVAVLFLLICMGLLFTAAAIELKHSPHPDPDDGNSHLIAYSATALS